MIVECGDIECKFYEKGYCIAETIHHTAERFCTTGKRKPKDDTEQLMRESEPRGFKRAGTWVSN